MATTAHLHLRVLVHVPWGERIPEDIVDVTPAPGDGQFQVAEPTRELGRSTLEPTASPAGIVARVLRGDGEPLPLALHVEIPYRITTLPAPPLALSAREDGGLWSLERDGLRLLPAAGGASEPLPLSGVRLAGAPAGAVWVVGLDEAWFVDAEAEIAGPFTWRSPLESIAVDGRLCRLGKDRPTTVLRLDSTGARDATAVSGAPEPMERLLWLDEDAVWTSTVDTLCRYGSDGVSCRMPIRGAGLTERGGPFLSGLEDRHLLLWREGPEPVHLPLSPAGLEAPDAAVVAVERERALVWDGRRGAWYRGDTLEGASDLDERSERDQLREIRWQEIAPYAFVGAPGGRVLVPVTGPSGVAVLEVWSADAGPHTPAAK